MLNITKKPIIGLIGRPDKASDDDSVICIWEGVRRAIVKKDGIPLLILPTQDIEYETFKPRDVDRLTTEQKQDLIRIIDLCDGILIPGGHKWYEYDEFIYNYALEKNIPILGICAGMQMIARIDNNKLNTSPDTTVKNETEINHRQRDEKYVHYVDIVDNTMLKDIIGETKIKVNSKHNYHVNTVNEFKISAYSEDGLIEAIEHSNKNFVLGLQWHPETMLEYDEYANKIFDRFIEECKNK